MNAKTKTAAVAPTTKTARTDANKARRQARHKKSLEKKARRLDGLASITVGVTLKVPTARGTARAKRRGAMKHWMVDFNKKSATLSSYGTKSEEGFCLVYSSSAKAAMKVCGIKTKDEVSDKTVAKRIVKGLNAEEPGIEATVDNISAVLNGGEKPKAVRKSKKAVAAPVDENFALAA